MQERRLWVNKTYGAVASTHAKQCPHPEEEVGPQCCRVRAGDCPEAGQADNDVLMHRQQLALHHMDMLLLCTTALFCCRCCGPFLPCKEQGQWD